MTLLAYFFLWFWALALALLVGLASHYCNAFLSAYPEKTLDGFNWTDHLINNQINENYIWWGHYDEGGWWEFYSMRNYAAHAAIPVIVVIGGGLVLLEDRAAVVERTCDAVASVGIVPLLCLMQ